MTRKVLKDITLPDGTFVPKNTLIVTTADAVHHDESHYADANTFDPFRFARIRENEGEGTKHQFVNTSLEYMAFGHGKHAWCVGLRPQAKANREADRSSRSCVYDSPGRFFAANELKAILAYIILNYDLKLGGDGKRPANIYYANGIIPAVGGQVLFRKRQDMLIF